MENSLFVLFAIILILIGSLIAYLIYFGQRFLKLQEKKMANMKNQQNNALTLDELVKSGKISADLAQAHQAKKNKENMHAKVCVDHPDVSAFKQCALSGEYLCQACITKQNDIWVAKKYMDLYLDTLWEELLMLPNSDDNQENIEKIMAKKRGLWSEDSLPVIVQGHYKINVENDEIESYLVVLVRAEDKPRLQAELSIFQ